MSIDHPENPLRVQYSDVAKRASDIVRLHLAADESNINKWVAINFFTGNSDNVVYEDPVTAARHQIAPEVCCYVNMVDDFSPRSAEAYLSAHRQFYEAGYRSDPEVPASLMPSIPGKREQWATRGLVVPKPRVIRPTGHQ